MCATILALLLVAGLSYPPASADFDGDNDIDQSDFGLLQAELGRPAMPYDRFDLDRSGTIDAGDLDSFRRVATGPGIPLKP